MSFLHKYLPADIAQALPLAILVETLMFFILAGLLWFYREVILQFICKVSSRFKLKGFPDRQELFWYQEEMAGTDFRQTVRDHLCNRSLLGDITPPNIYGVWDNNTPGGTIISKINKGRTKEDTKTRRYIRDCIIPFKVKINSKYINSGKSFESTLETEFIFRDVFLPFLNDTTPQMFSLRGKVGCGKSTLLSSLSHAFVAANKGRKHGTLFAPILVDVRKILTKRFDLNDNFHKAVINTYFEEDVIKYIKEEAASLLSDMHIEGISRTKDLYSIIEQCYEKNISPIIIFDELDYLYTDFARRIIATKAGPQGIYIDAYNRIFSELCRLHENLPGRLTLRKANTAIILSSRTSTEKIIHEIIEVSGDSEIHQIEVEEAGSDTVKQIIIKQLQVVQGLNKTSSKDKELAKTLIKTLGNNDINYAKNITISVHGVRHLINAIAKLATKDNSLSLESLSKILPNPGLLRLYQYIDGNPDYSQSEEGISNIYLVNSKMPKKRKEGTYQADSLESWLCREHLQSYWLKYLLVSYIIMEDQKREFEESSGKKLPTILFTDIVNKFYCVTSRKMNQYEESIVKLALLHASKVDHGRLIKFGFKKSNGITVIPATRLRFMCEEEIFWDFGYLMVIIEDKWLEVPRSLHKFFVKQQEFTVYNFINNYHNSKNSDKLKFIKYKAKQVLIFLEILKVSFFSEEERYQAVFDRLREERVDLDFLEVMQDHLNNSIIDFTNKYISTSAGRQVKEYIENLDFTEINNKIKITYDKYHMKPTYRSVDAMMKNYFQKVVNTEQVR